MWKQHELVMLPTNEKAIIHLTESNIFIISKELTGKSELYKSNPQHLYILSDAEIKEDDWYENNSVIFRADSKFDDGNNPNQNKNNKKILASTDTSLKLEVDGNRGDLLPDVSFNIDLPQIPQSFIEHFISEYNKGNVINEVMIEYEKIITDTKHYMLTHECKGFDEKLKINPNNTINIKPVKDS